MVSVHISVQTLLVLTNVHVHQDIPFKQITKLVKVIPIAKGEAGWGGGANSVFNKTIGAYS